MNTIDLINEQHYLADLQSNLTELNHDALLNALSCYKYPNDYPNGPVEPINTLLSSRKVAQEIKYTIDNSSGHGILFQAIAQLHNILLCTSQTADHQFHYMNNIRIDTYREIPDFVSAVIRKLNTDDAWFNLFTHVFLNLYNDCDSRDILKIVFDTILSYSDRQDINDIYMEHFRYGIFHWISRNISLSSEQFLGWIHEQYPNHLQKRDKIDNTPLHNAIENNNLNFVLWILKNNAFDNNFLEKLLKSRNNFDNTPLHLAAKTNHNCLDPILQYMIENSTLLITLIQQKNINGETPIEIRSQEGRLTLINTLCSLIKDRNHIQKLMIFINKMGISVNTKTEALTLLKEHFRSLQ